jgi:hypothetical protein
MALSESQIQLNKKRFLSLISSEEREGLGSIVAWLEQSDFFQAPASTKYHGAYPGGLCEHCLNVYELFNEECEFHNLGVPHKTRKLCALLHDICKVNLYVVGPRGGYTHRDDNPLGHGEKSLSILQDHMKLSPQEKHLIRWHMGPFTGGERYIYDAACAKYPEVVFFFCADYRASWRAGCRRVWRDE